MITRIGSEGLHPTSGYAHATLVESGRLALFAGQMPMDASGTRVVGVGDLDAQVDRTVHNAALALAAAGARPQDVVRTTVYVVTSVSGEAGRAWHRFAGSAIGAAFTSASTLLGVAVLGFPDQLVELEMTAVLSPGPSAS